jgi:O-antigen/teichoic acid export membrane protein
MGPNREYAKYGRQVGYGVGANTALLLLGFIRLPILTKGLGAALYGTWSLINVTISLIFPFALLGLSAAVVRFLAAEKDRYIIREGFLSACSVVFISGTAFSVLLFLFSDYLAVSIYKDIHLSSYIKLASILILFNSICELILNFFRMQRKIGLYTILKLSRHALLVGLIVISLLLGYKLTGVIIAVIVGVMLISLIGLLISLRQVGFHIPRFTNMKSYLKWGVPLIPNSAILWIIHVSDRYMISYFMGITAAGIYSAAYTIGEYASFTLMALSTVLYPTIIKSYEGGNLSETRKYLKYSLKYFMLIAIPSAFGLSVLAKPILSALTTIEFINGTTVIPFVAFGAILFGFHRICLSIIYIANKTQLALSSLGTSAALNIILNIILIPRIGILGAAVATFITCGSLGILTLLLSRRYLRFDLSATFALKAVLASAIMTLCIWFINPESITLVIISIFAGVIIYFGGLLLVKGISKSEIAFFMNFTKDNLRKIHIIGSL